MDEGELFNWLQEEKGKQDLAEVPKDVEKELIQFFKNSKNSKNSREMFNKIYHLREKKIVMDACFKAMGIQTLFLNMIEREEVLHKELVELLLDGRKRIFPFLEMKSNQAEKEPEIK